MRRLLNKIFVKYSVLGRSCLIGVVGFSVLSMPLAAPPAAGADGSQTQEDENDNSGDKAEVSPVGEANEEELKIVSDTVDIDFKEHAAVFEGNVKAYDNDQTLKADKMRVKFTQKDELKEIIAIGNVRITQPSKNRQAKAGRAHYDVASGTVTLTEEPSLRMGSSRIENAAEIVYDRDTQQVRSMSGGDQRRPELLLNRSGADSLFSEEDEQPQSDK